MFHIWCIYIYTCSISIIAMSNKTCDSHCLGIVFRSSTHTEQPGTDGFHGGSGVPKRLRSRWSWLYILYDMFFSMIIIYYGFYVYTTYIYIYHIYLYIYIYISHTIYIYIYVRYINIHVWWITYDRSPPCRIHWPWPFPPVAALNQSDASEANVNGMT